MLLFLMLSCKMPKLFWSNLVRVSDPVFGFDLQGPACSNQACKEWFSENSESSSNSLIIDKLLQYSNMIFISYVCLCPLNVCVCACVQSAVTVMLTNIHMEKTVRWGVASSIDFHLCFGDRLYAESRSHR